MNHELQIFIESPNVAEVVVNMVMDAIEEYFEIVHEREPFPGDIIITHKGVAKIEERDFANGQQKGG